MHHIGNPYTTHSESVIGGNPYSVTLIVEIERRRVIYFHDRMAGLIDVGKLVLRRLLRVHKATSDVDG